MPKISRSDVITQNLHNEHTTRNTSVQKCLSHNVPQQIFLAQGKLGVRVRWMFQQMRNSSRSCSLPHAFLFFEKEAIKEGLCTHPPVLILIALPKFLSHSSTPFCSNIEHLHWQLLKKEKHHGWLENPQTASTFFYNRRQTISALSIAVIQESMRQHAWF